MKLKIKEFYIGEANYYICDDRGGKLHLLLNYAENVYKINVLGDGFVPSREILLQAELIAKDLLGRKAKLNLVENLKQKGIIK